MNPKHNTGPRQNLSSYFSNEQVDQQLFGEEDMNEDDTNAFELQIEHNKKKQSSLKPSSIQHTKGNNRGNTNTHILQHFYNPSEESDGEEQFPTQSNIRQTKHQNQPLTGHPNVAYQKNSNQTQTSRQKKATQPARQNLEPQFPIYPNPYQFFPFYPPFYSPYSAGLTEEPMKEQFKNNQSNDTFASMDKSVESSIFFEKEKNIEMLLAESREMKQIIQCQSETIDLILKKLEEVFHKVDSINLKQTFQNFEKLEESNLHDAEPQPRQPPVNASTNNFYTQNPSRSSTSSSSSNMTSSLKNSMASPAKFANKSQLNESMTNNTSMHAKMVQNSSILDKSLAKSDNHSNRYSAMISPTISNSPIRSGSSHSSRLNSSQSSKKSVQTNSQLLTQSTISVNSDKSQNFDEKPIKSPLYSSSSLKDLGSPKSSKSDKQKRISDESFLNASHLSESMDLLGDAHGDDSFVYNASYMSSYSSSHLEPFSTEMQKYVKEKILVGDMNSKKDDIAKDSDNTFMTGSKKKKENSLSYSSSSFPIKSFSKI